jgi:glycosyltransferase involved in cell wall biosynthesis
MSVEPRRPTVAAIVMTVNEAVNIGKCLESLKDVDNVFVLDSASTDGTISIAEGFANASVVQIAWKGYAMTFNEGVELAIDYDWVLRIDADEELSGDIRALVAGFDQTIAGVIVRRKIFFQGELLRYGPHSRLKMLRLFRPRQGRCELTSVDEHVIVDGRSVYSDVIEVLDRDRKPASVWLSKHVRWAKREALNVCKGTSAAAPDGLDAYNRAKRIAKASIYYRFPPYLRAFLYFFYRLVICRECLGGRHNVSWCVMQGLWYRLLVDFYLLYPHLIGEAL